MENYNKKSTLVKFIWHFGLHGTISLLQPNRFALNLLYRAHCYKPGRNKHVVTKIQLDMFFACS